MTATIRVALIFWSPLFNTLRTFFSSRWAAIIIPLCGLRFQRFSSFTGRYAEKSAHPAEKQVFWGHGSLFSSIAVPQGRRRVWTGGLRLVILWA
jgi:hypothetical protein